MSVETELFKEVNTILEKFIEFWTDGVLNKSRVIEAIRNYKLDLISELLKNDVVKKTYTIEVSGTTIFKQDDFIDFFRYKDYWDSSYTRFSNEIGLSSEGKYLRYDSDVIIDFPFKDTVLEAGMTKDDVNKNEIYYHNILAKQEIDVLLSPKVFTNAMKYDEDGASPVDSFIKDENLIIKGNNLLALHSLKKQYVGEVKLIYIDPPYNTKSDSFKYNDRFNHASWLTFMKNRLEVAKDLLKDDGLILISIDDNEQAELKLLCNEIFGPNNFLANLVWNLKTGTQAGHFTRSHEYVLAFAKNKSALPNFSGGDGYIEHSALKKISQKNPASEFTFPKGTRFDAEDGTVLTGTWGDSEKTTLKSGIMRAENGKLDDEVVLEAGWAMKTQMTNWFNGEVTTDTKGQKVLEFYFNKNGILRYKKERGVINPKTVLDDVGSTKGGTTHLEELFGENPFPFPKNELLIERLISLTTSENDLILDFFLGSGTTASVAHKLGRRYIGIEQMDYVETVAVERLKKVIEGEQGGISDIAEWEGGGSFVYTELLQLNQRFVSLIQEVKDDEQLEKVIEEMKNVAFLNFKVDIDRLTNGDEAFAQLPLNNKKEILISTLDHNQVYVNYTEIDDSSYEVSEKDKAFNRSFYEGEGIASHE